MKCKKCGEYCGSGIFGDLTNCPNCGAPIGDDVSSASAEASPRQPEKSESSTAATAPESASAPSGSVAESQAEDRVSKRSFPAEFRVKLNLKTLIIICCCFGVGLALYSLKGTLFHSSNSFRLPGGETLDMVKCPAGSFTMGSPSNESERDNDEVQHRVTLTKPFWIGKYEVTQSQYEAVMGNNPSSFKGSDRPVKCVSWHDAMEFCEKLNEVTEGKRPAGYKFSLPTEAQWEYACRAGTTGAYADWSLDSLGWYGENSGNRTHDVGQKQPNAWGIYDMHGNVWEWCRDWYGGYTGDETDPTGDWSGSGRVSRGGCWDSDAGFCRSANRCDGDPGRRSLNLGFRVALVPVQ